MFGISQDDQEGAWLDIFHPSQPWNESEPMFHVIGDKLTEKLGIVNDIQLDECEGDLDVCVLFSHENISVVRDFLDQLDNRPADWDKFPRQQIEDMQTGEAIGP